MARWIKKPVAIEADVFTPGMEDGVHFLRELPEGVKATPHFIKGDPHDTEIYPYIATLEGNHYITPGDYIITGVKGERYPCKPDIFKMSYMTEEEYASGM